MATTWFGRSAALCAFVCAVAGCDVTMVGGRPPLPNGATDEELVQGSYTYERPEVGSISGCTATLVGQRLVITAAHCLDYATRNTPGRYGTFEIRRSASEVERYTIERYVSYGNTVGADDVALIRLATAVPESVAVPAGLMRTEPARGTPVTIYGYGCQTRNTSGRWAKQKLRALWRRQTTNLCPGDSGGPTMTDDGLVGAINSGYYVDSVGADIFGIVPVVIAQLDRTAASWGETFGRGMGMPDAGAPQVRDGGSPPPRDAGSIGRDAGPPAPPPPPPPGSGPCDRATCEEATALPGCGWCDATQRGLRVGSYGEALEPCARGYRLDPPDCAGAARNTCGPWSGIDVFTCRRSGLQFVRCTEGSVPEMLTCPSGFLCTPGSTERFCQR